MGEVATGRFVHMLWGAGGMASGRAGRWAAQEVVVRIKLELDAKGGCTRHIPEDGASGDEQVEASSLVSMVEDYMAWMRAGNYAPTTISSRGFYLGCFIRWCRERGLETLGQVGAGDLEAYRRWLSGRPKKNGEPLSAAGRISQLAPVRVWFAWLVEHKRLAADPALRLAMPRKELKLPVVLTPEEAERVLSGPDVTSVLGLRDRAMLEVLYATGIRRAELGGLDLGDVDLSARSLRVRRGKGRKDRMVPLGDRAAGWVQRYALASRPRLARGLTRSSLFLTYRGRPFSTNRLTATVGGWVGRAKLPKTGACHLFRHTAATLMLEGGADLRSIQRLLGHASLASTQLYTHVSMGRLVAEHRRTHPGLRQCRFACAQ